MEMGSAGYFECGFYVDVSTAMSFTIGLLGSYAVHKLAAGPTSVSSVHRTNDAACLQVAFLCDYSLIFWRLGCLQNVF